MGEERQTQLEILRLSLSLEAVAAGRDDGIVQIRGAR